MPTNRRARPIFLDCDILSTLAKVDGLELLDKLFPDSDLFMPSTVHLELERVRSFGYDFPDVIEQSRIRTAILQEQEYQDYEALLRHPRIHAGEAECLSLAQSRNGIVLTNDQHVIRACDDMGILVLSLYDILWRLARTQHLDRQAMLQLISDIETRDRTSLRFRENILAEY